MIPKLQSSFGTFDVQRRVADHNKGRGCRFTKYRHPVVLVHQEFCETKSSARRREIDIKKLARLEKLELITRSN